MGDSAGQLPDGLELLGLEQLRLEHLLLPLGLLPFGDVLQAQQKPRVGLEMNHGRRADENNVPLLAVPGNRQLALDIMMGLARAEGVIHRRQQRAVGTPRTEPAAARVQRGVNAAQDAARAPVDELLLGLAREPGKGAIGEHYVAVGVDKARHHRNVVVNGLEFLPTCPERPGRANRGDAESQVRRQVFHQGHFLFAECVGGIGADRQRPEGLIVQHQRKGRHAVDITGRRHVPPGSISRIVEGVLHDAGPARPDGRARGAPASLGVRPGDARAVQVLLVRARLGHAPDGLGLVIFGHVHAGETVAADLLDYAAGLLKQRGLLSGPDKGLVAVADRAKGAIEAPQLVLGLALPGLVLEDEHHPRRPALGILDRRAAVGNGALDAVTGNQQRVVCQADHQALGQYACHRVLDFLAAVFVDDVEHLRDIPAAGFVLAPSGKRLGHRVQQLDPALLIGGDNAVADAQQRDPVSLLAPAPGGLGVEERPVVLLAVSQPEHPGGRGDGGKQAQDRRHDKGRPRPPVRQGLVLVDLGDEKPRAVGYGP